MTIKLVGCSGLKEEMIYDDTLFYFKMQLDCSNKLEKFTKKFHESNVYMFSNRYENPHEHRPDWRCSEILENVKKCVICYRCGCVRLCVPTGRNYVSNIL